MLFKLVGKAFGCLTTILVILLLLGLGVGWAMLHFLPVLIEDKVEDMTGFRADFDGVEVKLFSGEVRLERARLENPESFPSPEFITIEEMRVDIAPSAFLRNKIVIKELVLDISEFGYIKTAQNEINVVRFLDSLRGAGASENLGKGAEMETREFLIERFSLRLRSLKIGDFFRSSPRIRQIETNIVLELNDVRDVKQILVPLTRELARSGLASLLGPIAHSVMEMETYRDLADSILAVPVETFGEGAKSLIEGVEETGSSIKNVIDSIKNK